MTKLKQRREKLNLTQKEVATAIGVTYQAYQRYEREEVVPNVKTAIKIAKALNVTVEELYG